MIARALILSPEFIVADEPVSMLDVSVRAGILNLLRDISRDLALTAVYISHDLSLVRYLCERTIVMYLGRIVEDAPTAALIDQPLHPYTQALVAAVPTPDPGQSRAHLPIGNTPPDARHAHHRLPLRRSLSQGDGEMPADRAASLQPAEGRSVACHLYGEAN